MSFSTACTICLNDFGVQSPEGINEAPIRVPWCRHIFGDHCIKRWFKDSNTCPYCRYQVPSDRRVIMPNLRESDLRAMVRGSLSGMPAGFDNRISGGPPGHPHGQFRNRSDGSRPLAPATIGHPTPTRARRDPSQSPPDSLQTPEQRRRARVRHASVRGSGPASAGTAAPGRSVPQLIDPTGEAGRQFVNYNPYSPQIQGHQSVPARNHVYPPRLYPDRWSSDNPDLQRRSLTYDQQSHASFHQQYTDPMYSRNASMMPTGYPSATSFMPYPQPSGNFMQPHHPFSQQQQPQAPAPSQQQQQLGSRHQPGNNDNNNNDNNNNNTGGTGATPGPAAHFFSPRQQDLRPPYGMAWHQSVSDHAATATGMES